MPRHLSLPSLILKFLPNRRCEGCGAIGYVDSRALTCFHCTGKTVFIEDRCRKLREFGGGEFLRLRIWQRWGSMLMGKPEILRGKPIFKR